MIFRSRRPGSKAMVSAEVVSVELGFGLIFTGQFQAQAAAAYKSNSRVAVAALSHTGGMAARPLGFTWIH